MTLVEAISAFSEHSRPQAEKSLSSTFCVAAIGLLKDYLRAERLTDLDRLTASRLRDFLARWYVETAAAGRPEPRAMLRSLEEFFRWCDLHRVTMISTECTTVLSELEENLPRAIEITDALSRHLAERGGAIGFPEFLTSFEQGGQSEYDLGERGEAGAVEGYFLIERVEGRQVEALELVSEKRFWPILFPEEAARIVEAGFIINLELTRVKAVWHISGCGFAFPPNTEIA